MYRGLVNIQPPRKPFDTLSLNLSRTGRRMFGFFISKVFSGNYDIPVGTNGAQRFRPKETLKPHGLRELSSDIIREVLRHQPQHLNGFIADYLETMLVVRENARDSGVVICDTLRQGYFFDELLKTKNVTREQANMYAVTIQAGWRGYVVRRKIGEWLKKKKKFEEEKEVRRSIRIEELLAGLGITYEEATRAAEVIQAAYKEAKRGKWITGDFGEFWVGESVPFGQRIREGDRARGRFDRWEKEDFGDFFEMDDTGAIKYVWPRFGQVRKVLRENVPADIPIIEFFGMRDLEGVEQYSYLIRSHPDSEVRGTPIGFLIPISKSSDLESAHEVHFVNPELVRKMGSYTFIFRDDVSREELVKFDDLLRTQEKTAANVEMPAELDYDPNLVLPRVLIRIKKQLLLETDDEVKFSSLPNRVVCEEDEFTFRAETLQHTSKIIRHILRDKCLTIEEGLAEAANVAPYRFQETGRIFPVEDFLTPKYIQKIRIIPESNTGEDELSDMTYEYIFLPLDFSHDTGFLKGEPEPILKISITRFQGFRSDYKGSKALGDKVFIMGPKITTPDGKPFTYESLFWEEFGPEAWYQLLYNIATQKEQAEEELMEEQEEEPLDEDILAETVTEGVKELDKHLKEEKDKEVEEVSESLTTVREASTVIEVLSEQLSEQIVEAEGEAKAIIGEGTELEPEKEGEKESEKEQEKAAEVVDE